MCQCCMLLLQIPRSALDHHYNYLIQSPGKLTYLPHLEHNLRRFGCINPGYRVPAPLKHGLECNPIVLALCDIDTGSNFNPYAASIDYPVSLNDTQAASIHPDAHSTHPSSVRYYRVTLVASGHQMDGNWKWRQSDAVDQHLYSNEINNQPLCAVVFGQNVKR